MKIEILQGTGFSRVSPDSYSLGGFSRVNKTSEDTYLSGTGGYRLNSTDAYILSGKKERQERRSARKEKREDRREDRQERRDERREGRSERKETRQNRREERRSKRDRKKEARAQRSEARTERKQKKNREGGFLDNLLKTGKEVFDTISPSLIDQYVPPQYQEMAYGMMEEGYSGNDFRDALVNQMQEDDYDDYDDYDDEDPNQKGLFRKKTWWEKRSKTEKGLIIGGGILVGDYLISGPISTQVLKIKKKKK